MNLYPPFTFEDLSREYIEKLGIDNPIVHTFLKLYFLEELNYEQALIGMVAHLVTHNNELVKLNIKKISESTPTWVIKK